MKNKKLWRTVAISLIIAIGLGLTVYVVATWEGPTIPEMPKETKEIPIETEKPFETLVTVISNVETEDIQEESNDVAEKEEEAEIPIAETEEIVYNSYTEEDVEYLAMAIYQEAGSDYICDECRYMVGDVILNRVADPRFADTIRGVLESPGQYGMFYYTGVQWIERAQYEIEQHAVERARETARALLENEHHSELYGNGYIWQAEFEQGYDIIYCDGTYFGRS